MNNYIGAPNITTPRNHQNTNNGSRNTHIRAQYYREYCAALNAFSIKHVPASYVKYLVCIEYNNILKFGLDMKQIAMRYKILSKIADYNKHVVNNWHLERFINVSEGFEHTYICRDIRHLPRDYKTYEKMRITEHKDGIIYTNLKIIPKLLQYTISDVLIIEYSNISRLPKKINAKSIIFKQCGISNIPKQIQNKHFEMFMLKDNPINKIPKINASHIYLKSAHKFNLKISKYTTRLGINNIKQVLSWPDPKDELNPNLRIYIHNKVNTTHINKLISIYSPPHMIKYIK